MRIGLFFEYKGSAIMAVVPLKQVKIGSILSSDVLSPFDRVLMAKGTRLEERQLEILSAFLVEKVEIVDEQKIGGKERKATISMIEPPRISLPNSSSPPERETILETPKVQPLTFEQHFSKAVQFFKTMFQSVWGGLSIPILQVRSTIEPLLKHKPDPAKILLVTKQNYALDDYTFYHSVAVGYIAAMIARWLKVPENEIMPIALAGTLHDIGKSKIDPQILYKPESLSVEEKQELNRYTVYGYHLVKSIPGIAEGVSLGVLQHQEREDGTGYPLGMQSEAIHYYAKIIAVADVFHAMCANKSYRPGISPYLVLEQLLNDSFGKLNPLIVRAFVESMTQFSAGVLVELSDGSIAKIVFIDRQYPTRPMVEVNGQIMNLATKRDLVIRRVVIESEF
jgi:HD-GYP domain-containing protein (c-di-GMP phosphodiesterase class II)